MIFPPTTCQRLIVKVGSALLVTPEGEVRREWLTGLVADIAARVRDGQQIAIVSSGAIALGARRLGLPKGGRAVTYHANLVYEYAVAGRAYRSNHFHIDGPQAYSFRRRAEAHLRKWPPGSAVTVYYDPARPDRATLSHKAQRIAALWFVLAFGGAVAVGLLGVLVFEPGIYGRDPLIRL